MKLTHYFRQWNYGFIMMTATCFCGQALAADRSSIVEQIKSEIKKVEGFDPNWYLCDAGRRTIGYGTAPISADDAGKILSNNCFVTGTKKLADLVGIKKSYDNIDDSTYVTEESADAALQKDLEKRIAKIDPYLGEGFLSSCSPDVQPKLVKSLNDMSYQGGDLKTIYPTIGRYIRTKFWEIKDPVKKQQTTIQAASYTATVFKKNGQTRTLNVTRLAENAEKICSIVYIDKECETITRLSIIEALRRYNNDPKDGPKMPVAISKDVRERYNLGNKYTIGETLQLIQDQSKKQIITTHKIKPRSR